ncbi:MAG: T9SS type A sorting domain-containing protein [Bacteroidota bacterium]
MKRILFTLTCLWLQIFSIAQPSTIINTGIAGTPAYNAGPVYRSSAASAYDVSRYSYLYTQSELLAAGITPGSLISKLGWVKNNAATTTGGGIFRIYMKNSSVTDYNLATETWANLNTGTTLVYENLSQTIPDSVTPAYITFSLNGAFLYTGGSLEISTEWDINQVSGNPSTGTFDWLWSTVPDRIYGTGQTGLANAGTLSSTTNSISDITDRRPFLQITYSSGTALDGALTQFTAPTALCPGLGDVIVRLANYGTDTINDAKISWTVNGVAQTPYYFTGSLSALNNADLTLGSFSFVAGTPYSIQAIVDSVNGTVDGNAADDTVNINGLLTGLSGNYTIDSGLVTVGTNYQSFSDFVSDLSSYGVCGPVVANVVALSGPYNEQVIINEVLGASSVNTITINGNGELLTFSSANTNERATIKLNGADHFTINNLAIGATGTYGFGVHFLNDADSNTISNCSVDIGSTSTSTNYAGIVISSSAASATTAGASNCDYNSITNNTIEGGYYGITLVANGSTSTILGNYVANNTITDFYSYGIYLNGNNGTWIDGNDISRPLRTNPTTFYAIYFTSASQNCLVSNNRIHNPFDGNPLSTSAAYGVEHTGCDATAGNENMVVNNLVYNFNGAGTQNGILNVGSDYVRYYHNTISLDDNTATCLSCLTRGFYQQTPVATGLDIKNNIFSLSRTGGGECTGLYFSVTGTSFTSDYNNFYIAGQGSTNDIGYINGGANSTLALWQTAALADSNSLNVNPLYTNPGAGNFAPSNSVLNDMGTALGVPTDITGAPRDPLTPDMGAYEFDVAGTDVGVTLVSTQTCPGTDSFFVTVQNFGTAAITSVVVYATINGVPTPNSGNTFTVNIASAGSEVVNLGAFTFVSGTSYTYEVYTSLPNGIPDANNPNDTLVAPLNLALTGSYTINSAVVTGGNNFQSFTDAASALNSFGVCGPVIMDVVSGSGPYNEQVVLNQISGASAVNTITINGKGETLTYDPTSTLKYILQFNGADYFTIDSLKIVGINATYGFGILLSNSSDYNTITNCEIDLSAITSTTTTNSAGICLSALVTSPVSGGNNANFNEISNNLIKGGASGGPYYGITLYGTTGAVGCNSNRVINNTISDFYNNGIRLNLSSACEVIGNDLSRPNLTSAGTLEGIYLTGTTNPKTKVLKNRIHNSHGANSTNASTVYAIDVTTDGGGVTQEILVANNAIYDINHNGIAYPIYISGSLYSNYYHNSISLDNASSTGSTSAGRGIYMLGTSDSINIKNNVISVTKGGTGTMYGLYYSTLPANLKCDFNDVYVNTASTSNYFGYNGSPQITLADWIATSFRDSSSQDVNPLFASAATGDLTPAAASINNIGQNLTADVPDDILSTPRTTTPDPGAFEFTPSLDDAGVSAINSPSCPGTDSVLVTVLNSGAAQLTSVEVYVTANGIPSSGSGSLFLVNLQPGEDTVLNMGTVTYSTGIIYDVVAFTSQPNGFADANNLNDTSTTLINLGLTGSFTINSAVITGGTNFQSFTDAASALKAYGICGPLVIDVVSGSGPYNEQVEFDDVSGTSAINTVTINGNGETLTFAPTSTLKYVLRLNGADYFTIDSLKIVGSNATYGFGILLSNNSDYNTIRNCEIDLSAITSTTSTNSCGICLSASVTSPASGGNNGSFNEIVGNLISGGTAGGPYYGITLYGTTGAVGCNANKVTGNSISNFYNTGIRMSLSSASEAINNDISRANITVGTGVDGISLIGASNPYAKILKNRVHNIYGANTSSTGTFTGIDVTTDGGLGQEIIVANNTIYDIIHNGIDYGIYISGSLYSNYYHNSISFDNIAAIGTSTVRGIYLLGTSDNVNVKNNAISITRGGTGAMYGLYYTTIPAGLRSDNNDVYVSAASNTSYFGYNGTAQPTLAAWISTSLLDSNSISIIPEFLSTTDLHSTSPFLNDRGALGLGILDDIDGDIRCPEPGCAGNTLRPDIGADEFLGAPVTVDIGTDGVISPTQSSCYSTSETVSVQIKNYNTQGLDFSLYPVTVYASATGTNPIVYTPLLIDTGTLDPDSTLILTFDTNYDMSVPGTYTFSFYTTQGSDANAGNDSLLNYGVEFTVGTISNTFAEVCSGSDFELKMDGITGPVQWQSYDDMNAIWVNETGIGSDSVAYTVSPVVTTLYRALVCGNYPSATDTLVPITVASPVVNNDTICSGQTASLVAVGSGVKNWYSAATGGTAVFTGDTLAVATSLDTTFYVESSQQLTGGSGSLKITEIYVDDPDAMEIQNLSASPINTTGWVVAISNNYSNINTVNPILWSLPASIASGQILTRDDLSGSPNYWGNNMLWNPANGSTRGWAMILDNLGAVVDFVVWDNWPAGALNTFNPTVNGFSVTLGNQWMGDTASTTGIGTQSLARVGSIDNNNRTDFVFQTASIGSPNPGLSTVFQGGSCLSVRVAASVKVEPSPVVSLGSDTTQCEGTVTLDAGNPGETYLWNTLDITQSITVDTSGVYSVTVTSANGCIGNDAINVNIAPFPVANLGNDTSLCGGSIILSTSNLGNNFVWSTGSTASFITVTTSGDYSVTVTTPVGCSSLDSVTIAINSLPTVALGGDTAQCGGSVILDAQNSGSTFEWSGGETSQIISVTSTGNYVVTITDVNSCTAQDAVNVTINSNPLVDLGSDSTQCGGSISLNAGNAGSSFMWGGGETSQTIQALATGNYSVTVTDVNSCTGEDAINVTINALPSVTFSVADTICSNQTPITLAGSPTGGTFSGSGVTGNTFNPATSGTGIKTITYSYTDNNGCTASIFDNIEVVVCVGIEETIDNLLLLVYPNPSTGFVHVNFSASLFETVTLEVFSTDGKLVHSLSNLEMKNTVDLDHVAAGLYTFRIVSPHASIIKQILIE